MIQKRGEVEVMVLEDHIYSMSRFHTDRHSKHPRLLTHENFSLPAHTVIDGLIFNFLTFDHLRSHDTSPDKSLIICVMSRGIQETLSKEKIQKITKKKNPYKQQSERLVSCCSPAPLFYHLSCPYHLIIQYLLFSSFLKNTLIAVTFPLQALIALQHHTHKKTDPIQLTETTTSHDLINTLSKEQPSFLHNSDGQHPNLLHHLLYAVGSVYSVGEIL